MKTTTLALTASLLAVSAATPRADILEQVLVKVNGDIITKTDLEQRQVATLRQKKYADLLPGYGGVTYLDEGPARLVLGGVEVGGRRITAPKVIVATGPETSSRTSSGSLIPQYPGRRTHCRKTPCCQPDCPAVVHGLRSGTRVRPRRPVPLREGTPR